MEVNAMRIVVTRKVPVPKEHKLKYDAPLDSIMSFKADAALKERLEAYCRKNDVLKSDVIRTAVSEYLDKKD